MRRILVLVAALALSCQPAQAEPDGVSITTGAALEEARKAYSRPSRRERCLRQTANDEIVVCGDDDEAQRIPPTSETDPTSREALRDGLPRAPDVGRKYPGKVLGRGCFPPPCPKPVYFFDIAALPAPPAGSDAERVANGEDVEP